MHPNAQNKPRPAIKRKNTVFQPSSVRCELLVLGKVPGSVYIREISVGQVQQCSKGIFFHQIIPETKAKPALHKMREHKQHNIYTYISKTLMHIFQPNTN